MINASIIQNLSTDDARCKAFADYLRNCAESYAELIGLLAESVSYDVIEEGQDFSDYVNQFLTEKGLNGNLCITLNDGYTDLRSVFAAVMGSTHVYSDVELIPGTTTPVLDYQVLELHDINNDPVARKLSFNDIVDQMQESLTSTICAAGALYAGYKTNITDRITFYKEYISDVVNNSAILSSNSYTYYKNILLNTELSAQTIGSTIINSIGVLKRGVDGDTGILNNYEINQYTGTTPVLTLDFYTVTKAIITLPFIVSEATAKLIKGLWELAKPVFNKAVKKVEDVLYVNDLEVSNESGVPSIDGWCVTQTVDAVMPSIPLPSALSRFLSQHGNKWLKYEFLLGEILCRVETQQSVGAITGQYNSTISIKPYAVNPLVVMECFNRAGFAVNSTSTPWSIQKGTTTSYEDVAQALSYMSDYGQDLYLDPNTRNNDEELFYNGFAIASYLLKWLILFARHQIVYLDSDYDNYITSNPFQYTYRPATQLITNADFVQLASGWNKDVNNPTFTSGPFGSLYVLQSVYIISTCFAYQFFEILLYQTYDRWANPGNYMFLPYRSNIENFLPSKYHVKTDRDNQKALDAFVNILTLVVVGVVLTVTCAVIAHKITKNLFWKRYQKVGTLDQKIWNGEALTNAEKRIYRRYQRKLNLSNFLTSSLTTTATSLSNNSNEGILNSTYGYMIDKFTNTDTSVSNVNTKVTNLGTGIGQSFVQLNSTMSNQFLTTNGKVDGVSQTISDKANDIKRLISGNS